MLEESDPEGGFATALGVIVVLGLAAVLMAMLAVGSWLLAHSRATAVADLAALAAATQGSCRAAEEVARINASRVQACSLQEGDAVVVIEVEVRGSPFGSSKTNVQAAARAGY